MLCLKIIIFSKCRVLEMHEDKSVFFHQKFLELYYFVKIFKFLC
jgi:hypothetical protein